MWQEANIGIGIGYWYQQDPIILGIGYWVAFWYRSNPIKNNLTVLLSNSYCSVLELSSPERFKSNPATLLCPQTLCLMTHYIYFKTLSVLVAL